MKILKKLTFISFIICITQTACVQSNDWTKWRGPTANGSSPETNWSPDSLSSENILWKTKVGMGHSAVVVKGNKLYTMGNYMLADSSYQDVVVCLDTETAKEIWNVKYPCPELIDPGPYSSPLIDDGYLYTLSRRGQLFCFDAEDGTIIWEKDLGSDSLFHKSNINAASPLVYKNLLILNVNHHGIAFNKKNGSLVWSSEIGASGISTPVFFEMENKTYMTIQNDKTTFAVNPENGDVLWQLDFVSLADPIISENKLFIPSYKGLRKYEMQEDEAKLSWENTNFKTTFQNHVKSHDYIYGFKSKKLQCISLEDGNSKWQQTMDGGALIIANDVLIIIDYHGKLTMAEATPEGYKELSSIQAIINPEAIQHPEGYRRYSACWTNPVLCNGKIYLRNTYGDLVCVNVGS